MKKYEGNIKKFWRNIKKIWIKRKNEENVRKMEGERSELFQVQESLYREGELSLEIF